MLEDIYSYIFQMNSSDTSYDKIKHLVEIEDDIFAVFTIDSRGNANGLTIAKNVDIENSLIENIVTNLIIYFNKKIKK